MYNTCLCEIIEYIQSMSTVECKHEASTAEDVWPRRLRAYLFTHVARCVSNEPVAPSINKCSVISTTSLCAACDHNSVITIVPQRSNIWSKLSSINELPILSKKEFFELCLRNIWVENVSHKAIKKKSYTNKIMCLLCLRPSYLEIMFVIARRVDTVDLPGIYENSPTITSLGK